MFSHITERFACDASSTAQIIGSIAPRVHCRYPLQRHPQPLDLGQFIAGNCDVPIQIMPQTLDLVGCL
jgi:hypothetical protein